MDVGIPLVSFMFGAVVSYFIMHLYVTYDNQPGKLMPKSCSLVSAGDFWMNVNFQSHIQEQSHLHVCPGRLFLVDLTIPKSDSSKKSFAHTQSNIKNIEHVQYSTTA